MRRQLLILMLLLVTNLAPVSSRPISLRAKTLQNGSMRMPFATQVFADYDDGKLAIDLLHYTGKVQVYVYNADGFVVGNTVSVISGSGSVIMDLDLPEGNYTICIVLDNATYSGDLSI